MAYFYRFRSVLHFAGGGPPGYCIFHTTTGVSDDPGDIGNFMQQINAMWTTVGPIMAAGGSQNVEAEVTKHDVATGKMVTYPFSVTPPPIVNFSGGGAMSSPFTMALARHHTDALTDRGRRLQGRTFLGPIGQTAIDGAGGLSSAAQDVINGAWGGMQDVAGTSRLIVWHRPQDAVGTPGTPGYRPATIGSFGHVQNTEAWYKLAVLRSRRD